MASDQVKEPRELPNTRCRSPQRFSWAELPQAELLDVRLCDLGLTIEGTWLEERIERLYGELAERGLCLRPHCWLSEEWFSPAGIAGVALPFYLAHPRLLRLERTQMREVDGGTMASCLRLLRHETGHAFQHAYGLARRPAWQKIFGRASAPYPTAYRPNPASKRYVQHLEGWYAQAHPDEDFAETFAVWLQPHGNWRKRYAGWPALKKLEYVDGLMRALADVTPPRQSRRTPYSLSATRTTLGDYYARKRAHHKTGSTTSYDRDLLSLFGRQHGVGGERAAAFLRRQRLTIRTMVTRWAADYQFTVDRVFKEMLARSHELGLVARGPDRRLTVEFAILLTVHSMHYLHRVREWHAM